MDLSVSMPEFRFLLCHNVDGEEFADAVRIYLEAFPDHERQPIEIVRNRILTGKTQLYLGYFIDEVAGIAMLWRFENSGFILLDYLAVKGNMRNNKIGSAMFHYISAIAQKENKYLLLEIEHPLYGPNRSEREKRLDFYIRNGASVLKDVPYFLPSLGRSLPTEMLLLISPVSENRCFEKRCIVSLIKRLYLEVYGKDDRDALLNSFIDKVPDRVSIADSF